MDKHELGGDISRALATALAQVEEWEVNHPDIADYRLYELRHHLLKAANAATRLETDTHPAAYYEALAVLHQRLASQDHEC